MAVLKRGAVPAPGRTRVEVEVPALGGAVIASSLATVGEQLALLDTVQKDRGAGLPRMLAAAVLDADGEPLWSEDEWSVWLASHMGDTTALELAVLRAWGLGRDAAKDAEKN